MQPCKSPSMQVQTSAGRHPTACRVLLGIAAFFFLSANFSDVAAQGRVEITTTAGEAYAIDGDTISVRNQRLRLWGIDAPEKTQPCLDAKGQMFACGTQSQDYLAKLIQGHPLTCQVADVDQHKRPVVHCRTRDTNQDINASMVSAGMAMAYTRFTPAFAQLEAKARAAKVGFWAGTWASPEEHRRRAGAK